MPFVENSGFTAAPIVLFDETHDIITVTGENEKAGPGLILFLKPPTEIPDGETFPPQKPQFAMFFKDIEALEVIITSLQQLRWVAPQPTSIAQGLLMLVARAKIMRDIRGWVPGELFDAMAEMAGAQQHMLIERGN